MKYELMESEEGKKAREALDKLVNEALQNHTKTHVMVSGYPPVDWEKVFDEVIKHGLCNGKTVTFLTPKGTITFHATVGVSDE